MYCVLCGGWISQRRRHIVISYRYIEQGPAHPGCLYRMHEAQNRSRILLDDPRYWVYLLRCADRTIYVGMTGNLKRRLYEHYSGKGSRYTLQRMPIGFLGAIPVANEQDALQVENRLWQIPTRQRRIWAMAHGLRSADEAIEYDDAFHRSGYPSWDEWVRTGAYDVLKH